MIIAVSNLFSSLDKFLFFFLNILIILSFITPFRYAYSYPVHNRFEIYSSKEEAYNFKYKNVQRKLRNVDDEEEFEERKGHYVYYTLPYLSASRIAILDHLSIFGLNIYENTFDYNYDKEIYQNTDFRSLYNQNKQSASSDGFMSQVIDFFFLTEDRKQEALIYDRTRNFITASFASEALQFHFDITHPVHYALYRERCLMNYFVNQVDRMLYQTTNYSHFLTLFYRFLGRIRTYGIDPSVLQTKNGLCSVKKSQRHLLERMLQYKENKFKLMSQQEHWNRDEQHIADIGGVLLSAALLYAVIAAAPTAAAGIEKFITGSSVTASFSETALVTVKASSKAGALSGVHVAMNPAAVPALALCLTAAMFLVNQCTNMENRKTDYKISERRHQELLEAIERQKLQKEEMEK